MLMTPARRSRRLLSLIAAAFVASLTLGCGSNAPEFEGQASDVGVLATEDAGATLEDAASTPDSMESDDTMGTWVDTGAVVSENTNKLCSDGKDNDGDGQVDCDDLSCQTGVGVTVCESGVAEADNSACSDGKDNDDDGKIDCFDDDCNNNIAVTVCSSGDENTNTTCSDGLDNDGDGKTDCSDSDCKDNPTVTVCNTTGLENTNAACSDGKDNDSDGYTDCDDFDCSKSAGVTVCGVAKVENTNALCNDGIDNDSNGYTDCDDFGCSKNASVTVCQSTGPTCGDGSCDPGESAATCPADCASNTADSCKGRCGDAFDGNYNCQCDSQCQTFSDCCNDYQALCTTSGAKCGDGTCDSGESMATCPADCTSTGPTCGDGTCDPAESPATCPADCKSGGCPQPCDDGQACTVDTCDSATSKCVFTPATNGTKCADGSGCQLPSTCSAGTCQAGKVAPDGKKCPGGGACKAGVCEGATAMPPAKGDLIFTELMVRSQAGMDTGEWIELTNVSNKTLALGKLTLAKGQQSISFPTGSAPTLNSGARLVIGVTKDATKNHGAPVDLAQTKIKLGNNGGMLVLRVGQNQIDKVIYTKAQVQLGVALQLSSDKHTATANDQANAWCLATASYGTGGKLGSPGKSNSTCQP